MPLSLLIIFTEIVLITVLNYEMSGTHVSLDVLYCLPIIQAARVKALQAKRSSDSYLPLIIGFTVGMAWSLAEALVANNFPAGAIALNIFTRGVTFTVLGRVVARLWKEREYGHKDFLTDLANRPDFLDKFKQEQVRSERSRKPYSLLFIDIDRFKKLNDDQGHSVGDVVLHRVAEVLRASSRKVDTIARLGGDEFVLLFPETDAQGAELLKSRIMASSGTEFQQHGWDISLSIGEVTHIGNNKSPAELLDEADEIMYATKKAKRAAALAHA
ncbi:MAG: GGDEF domain-containing protein [Pseudomonadota bacterium]